MTISNRINNYFIKEDWKNARLLILKELKKNPGHHWFLTRLSTTYHEEKNYKESLRIVKKALRISPNCPLVNWDYAGSLYMLGKDHDAIRIWKKLIRRGINSIAYDECGEGLIMARRLVNDCIYRIGLSYSCLGNKKLAVKYILKHIHNREDGIKSIYNLREVKKRLEKIRPNK